jgi:hypothetical protein
MSRRLRPPPSPTRKTTDMSEGTNNENHGNGAGSPVSDCSDCVEDALRVLLFGIRERQEQLTEKMDKYTVIGAIESREVLRKCREELDDVARTINVMRYRNANPNPNVERMCADKTNNIRS